MLDFDNLREIWSTIKKNKLRTFLTGFSVSWGIFMLISLLGAGNGLSNGVMYNFRDLAANRIEVWTRYTSKPWKGMKDHRYIQFTNDDYTALAHEHKEIDLRSAILVRTDTLFHNNVFLTGRLSGIYPDHSSINFITLNSGMGRFINELDINENRKVIVLSPRMKEVLFQSEPAIGKYVRCGDTMFQVVGVYYEKTPGNDAPAYIPITTAQRLFNQGDRIHNLAFTVKGVTSEAENEAFEARFRERTARRHQFDPTDKSAIGIWNTGKEMRMFESMINGITLFIWIVGIGTLMAGIVGVSNIMLITVKERTREFGIRKAIGAKPSAILKLVIFESILITAVFGYLGMISAIGLTEGINYVMEMSMAGSQAASDPMNNPTIFKNPTVDLSISLMSTALIVVAGVLAGYFPARKAVKVSAIEAMRAE
jgi:putative ABC transport system permease protein